jgi:undecaprenyl-diphosphatase
MLARPESRLFTRADAFEFRLCERLNRACRRESVRDLFRVVSRLGDGIVWYVLMLLIPIRYGEAGLRPALTMAVVGCAGVGLYKLLKSRLVRERPYITFERIVKGTAPLDRYSFPSGHTLHAVAFTSIAVAYFPPLGWLLIPFAVLVAASRVVLGLHYPSDVLAGAAIGAGLARLALALA